jgi:hypothetical protein
MKKNLAIILLYFTVSVAYCQKITKAVTENGDEVVLYSNGTWKFTNDSLLKSDIRTEIKPFYKNENATFLVKSNKTNFGIWINPKEWSFNKYTNDEVKEYEFQLKKGDVYGILISEKVNIPLEGFKEIAVANASKAAKDLEIVKQEFRTINNTKVLFMEFVGTLKGIKFHYMNYYFSDDSGCHQLIVFTSENLINEHRTSIEDLLNGTVADLKK